jgi:hypothetical protein
VVSPEQPTTKIRARATTIHREHFLEKGIITNPPYLYISANTQFHYMIDFPFQFDFILRY